MANFFGKLSADRAADIAAVWQADAAPADLKPLHQELQSGKTVVHTEDVDVSKLWSVDQQGLRGHALKWILIEAQKITKRSIELRAAAQEKGEEVPALVTVQQAFDWLCDNGVYQTVQGVTPSADGTTKAKKKETAAEVLARETAGMTEEQKIDKMVADGQISEATASILKKQVAKTGAL